MNCLKEAMISTANQQLKQALFIWTNGDTEFQRLIFLTFITSKIKATPKYEVLRCILYICHLQTLIVLAVCNVFYLVTATKKLNTEKTTLKLHY